MNTPACLANQTAKQMYRDLIRMTLVDNNVKTVLNTEPKEHFFDKIEVSENGGLKIWRHGLDFDNFYFDYTMDFARCLSYLEDAIYSQSHGGKALHGYNIEFNA